jgi:acyl transferase domain-containing protein
LTPEVAMSQLSTLGFLSPDGRSYSFDARANGYAKGEGLGMVVLKRVSDAIRDGDTIRAVVRATAINQDGRTPGITQPSQKAQTDNILSAYRTAGLNLDETVYFEAHGTGTGEPPIRRRLEGKHWSSGSRSGDCGYDQSRLDA